MFGWRKGNREQRRRREAERAKIMQALDQIQLREPTSGPEARPWKERPTTRPEGLLPANWEERWLFQEPNEHGYISMPEECVGAIFPDDTVDINGRRWTVSEVWTHHDWPVAKLKPAK